MSARAVACLALCVGCASTEPPPAPAPGPASDPRPITTPTPTAAAPVTAPVTASGPDSGDVAAIRARAERCVEALQRGEHEVFADCTHARLVAKLGGRSAMVSLLAKGARGMQAEGVSFASVQIGEIAAPRTLAGWQVAVVPQTITMQTRDGRLTTRSSLIAISEDAGRSWVLLDAVKFHDRQFLELFPELRGLEVPAASEPTFVPGS